MASNLTKIQPNKLHTPKWLKYLLILEIVYATLTLLVALPLFINFNIKPPIHPYRYTRDEGLGLFISTLTPWLIMSFYTKILVKSWKQIFNKYRLATILVFVISVISGTITTMRSEYEYLSKYRDLERQELFLGLLQSFWDKIFLNLFVLSIYSFLFFGLLYGLIALYSNFKKTTSIPWWNVIYLPISVCFILMRNAQFYAHDYEIEFNFTTKVIEQVLRFGFLSIPLIFLVFLILEYREMCKG